MATVRRDVDEGLGGRYQEPWVAWPVAWSAVWIGALTALAVALIIGLLGWSRRDGWYGCATSASGPRFFR